MTRTSANRQFVHITTFIMSRFLKYIYSVQSISVNTLYKYSNHISVSL